MATLPRRDLTLEGTTRVLLIEGFTMGESEEMRAGAPWQVIGIRHVYENGALAYASVEAMDNDLTPGHLAQVGQEMTDISMLGSKRAEAAFRGSNGAAASTEPASNGEGVRLPAEPVAG